MAPLHGDDRSPASRVEVAPPLPQESVAELVEEVERRSADIALFETLHDNGFRGPCWDRFAAAVAEYALGVLTGWAVTGHVFTVLRGKGIPLQPTPVELHLLAADDDFRDELVDTAVATALHRFRKRSLEGSGWNSAGGASLTTYFTCLCAMTFAEALKQQRRDETNHNRSLAGVALEAAAQPDGNSQGSSDPAEHVSDQDLLRRYLARLPQRDRNIVWGKASGKTNTEIAEIYGESARAIAKRWSHLMATEDWIHRVSIAYSRCPTPRPPMTTSETLW